ncbi:MAG: AAA family ATPase [Treponema sp.]|nr:AAA family ATPase [Treponema sp.]
MKLKSLWIKDYKNLKDFHLDFEQGNNLSILIGNNGSGKSNVLEAISGIFAEAYRGVANVLDSDYFLDYELDGKNYKLEKKNGKRIYHYDELPIPNGEIIQNLPSNVIALYSGEDLRLWERFYEKRYKDYLSNIYRKGSAEKLGMYYVNKYLWNVSLLTLILFMDIDGFSDVKSFLETELGIKKDTKITIRIDFSYKKYDENINSLLKAFVSKINPDKNGTKSYSVDELRNSISNSVDSFEAEPREFFNLLMQAFMPKDFKLITDICIYLNDNEAIQFFSEGEKKLILIETVLEFVADENSIILLDEPDANIHEERKRKLYDLLRNTPNRDVVMTTHSPTFVDIADDDELIVLRSDDSTNCYVDKIEKIEQIRYLTGNRFNIFSEKPILYCEGGTTSVEAELYPILFPEYTIVPSGGHTEVINYTKMYNATFKGHSHAVGIIDGDYICQEQKDALEKEDIYSLSVLEVENVLMDFSLLEIAKQKFCSDENCISKVKKYTFDDCVNRKEHMLTTYTKNHVVSKIIAEISTDGKTIEDFKKNVLSKINNELVDSIYNAQLQKFNELLSANDYEELVRIIDFDHNINRFAKDVVDNYQSRIIRLIRKMKDLQIQIRQKYYTNI